MIFWRLRRRWGMKKSYDGQDEIMKDVMRLYNVDDRFGCYMSFRNKDRVHVDPRGKCGRGEIRMLKVLCFRNIPFTDRWVFAGKHRADRSGNGGNCT